MGSEAIDLEEVMALSVKEFVTPEQIEALEAELLSLPNVYECPVKHTLHDGIYIREITMPKGSFAIGHAHTGDFINIVTKGSCSVLLDGEVRKVGPSTFISKGHDRKVGYVHEDITWISVHRTDLDSVEEIERTTLIYSDTFKKWKERQAIKAGDTPISISQ
jgi:quercetin dioxygenase-like cupin family protein